MKSTSSHKSERMENAIKTLNPNPRSPNPEALNPNPEPRVGEIMRQVKALSLTKVKKAPLKGEYGSIWGSYYNLPKAIFYLLKGDYRGEVHRAP